MKPELLIEQLRKLPPDEIRQRLEELDAEQKALRYLLRTRLDATPRRGKEAPPCE